LSLEKHAHTRWFCTHYAARRWRERRKLLPACAGDGDAPLLRARGKDVHCRFYSLVPFRWRIARNNGE
jgi:hypothetical protein